MDYKIFTVEDAIETLSLMTGIPAAIWLSERYKVGQCIDNEKIFSIIELYNGCIPKFEELNLIFSHITTSANGCAAFIKYGLMDLKETYSHRDTELREFLDAHGIEIRLDYQALKYKENYYSIEYDAYDCPPKWEELAYAGWCVGRKFYYDANICGFLCIDENIEYAGGVHRRPEILMDIDNLLNTNLEDVWIKTHDAYEIVIRKPISCFLVDGNDEEVVRDLLIKAYSIAVSKPSEDIIICKPNIGIESTNIINIKPLTRWLR